MKNKLTAAADALMCAALIVSLFLCLCTSFEISARWELVIIPTVIFCAVYTLLSCLVKKTFKLFVCVTVTMAVFVVSLVFSFSEILSQLGYVLTQIFSQYSLYYALPESVTLGGKTASNATGLFVFISALLSAAFAISLVRCRKIFVIAALSVILLVPCFILINTLPDLPPLLAVIAILLTLYLTRNMRKFRPSQCGAVSLCALAAASAVLAVTLAFNPVETYERAEWQDSLLANMEELFNLDSGGLSLLDKAQNSLEKTQNLSEVSELEQTHTPQMTVTSTQKSGEMYLFGTAYANYSDNTWSVLTDEQKASYTEELNPFTMTTGSGDSVTTKVHMLNRGSLMYFPYFNKEFSSDCENLYDICMAGSGTDFVYSHSPFGSETSAVWWDTDYPPFIESTYLQIPYETKSALLEAALEKGWFDSLTEVTEPSYGSNTYETFSIELSELTGYYDTETIAEAVKSVVSQSAEYSLDTAAMPNGKDFPVWFLTESSTGYCVHFATAATLMLRSLDVPARYVTGYYFTLSDGAATVTSDNAHAWCEYYLEGTGWIPLECTPASFTPAVYTGNFGGSSDSSDSANSQNSQISAGSGSQNAVSPAEEPTTVQPTTAAQSAANSEAQDGDSNVGGSGTDSESFKLEWNALTIALIALVSIALAFAVIFLRRIIILNNRKKRLYSGTTNSRTVEAYREILKLVRRTHTYVSPEIKTIYERARFSSHKITDDELGKILGFYVAASKNILSTSPLSKRIYLRYIVVISN